MDETMLFLGIDPGANGALAVLDYQSVIVDVCLFAKATERDRCEFLDSLQERMGTVPMRAMLEQVSAMPKQGVVSTFKFGESFGFLRGMLSAMQIPFELVRPQRWQKDLGCRSAGDKNVTKTAAQRLWPQHKVTHGNADALLIAEFGRREWLRNRS